MSELKKIYEVAGGELEKVLARYGGNEKMLKHFLHLFVKDSSFSKLQEALASDKTEEAFRAAHTLKGICANLGFEGLYKKASEITEILRRGELDDAKPIFPGLAELYGNVIEIINRYLE